MPNRYRRLAVFVDCPSESSFLWVVIESTEDPAVWLDLETAPQSYDAWIDAFDAGNAALLLHVEDKKKGPARTRSGRDAP